MSTVYAYIYTYIHIYTHTYIYIHIHTYIYTYIYIYTHIHVQLEPQWKMMLVKFHFSKTLFFIVFDLLVFLVLRVQGWGGGGEGGERDIHAYNCLYACEIPL